ncbi:MAG: DUF4166 domain-containing protein [Planctomycetota bacterium]
MQVSGGDRPPLQHSPLEHVFAGAASVPFAFAEQFLHGKHLPYGMRLDGVMHRIWHRPRLLTPLFWLLGKLGILVPFQAQDVPTTLVVTPGHNERDGLYHVWDRTLEFDPPIRFRTTIIYDNKLDKVVDLVGPGDRLYMVWDGQFHEPDRFTLDTHSIALRLFGREWWLPKPIWKFFFGTVVFSQVASAENPAEVKIDLLIKHPLFGRIFGYEGTFRVVRLEPA